MENANSSKNSENSKSIGKKIPKSVPSTASKRALKKKAIAREYEMKRRELGLDSGPLLKKGMTFYFVVIAGLVLLGSLLIKKAGTVDKKKSVNTKMLYAQKSVDALAEALGQFKFHCGCYPTAEDGGLEALSAKTSRYEGWLGPYAGSWGHMIPDPWKRPYVYETQTNGLPIVLSLGPDGIRGTSDDVTPNDELFEKPFKDTSWTNNWVHFSKRGIIVVPKKKHDTSKSAK
ncbi:MAG: type II secretion system protein GspG [Kiritimatiellae bacterium]|nr:type II secretion system protein GspG [Kiritimatiellia bacterium]